MQEDDLFLTVAVVYNRILLIFLLFGQPENSRWHFFFPFWWR